MKPNKDHRKFTYMFAYCSILYVYLLVYTKIQWNILYCRYTNKYKYIRTQIHEEIYIQVTYCNIVQTHSLQHTLCSSDQVLGPGEEHVDEAHRAICNTYMYIYIYIYTHTYIYVCVCSSSNHVLGPGEEHVDEAHEVVEDSTEGNDTVDELVSSLLARRLRLDDDRSDGLVKGAGEYAVHVSAYFMSGIDMHRADSTLASMCKLKL
jgi:hypothetical protein